MVSSSDGDLTGDASLVGDSPGLVSFNDPGANTSVVDPLALACFSRCNV